MAKSSLSPKNQSIWFLVCHCPTSVFLPIHLLGNQFSCLSSWNRKSHLSHFSLKRSLIMKCCQMKRFSYVSLWWQWIVFSVQTYHWPLAQSTLEFLKTLVMLRIWIGVVLCWTGCLMVSKASTRLNILMEELSPAAFIIWLYVYLIHSSLNFFSHLCYLLL